jgi:putative pyruvate formate lyase activating enzyme
MIWGRQTEMPEPRFTSLYSNGELARRAETAVKLLAECRLCPRNCGADRRGEAPDKAFCRTGRQAALSSVFLHHGEEACLRGWNGSGTIFFTQCNLRCVFCQNYDISCQDEGRPASAGQLANVMLRLQDEGAHNINFVTPTHVVPQILESLLTAAKDGLRLPLVYNSGGYDKVETLRLLDGVIDIYMPDFKFWDSAPANEYAQAPDYPETAQAALKEMHRQVGDLQINGQGLAQQGLLVRHLVLPGGLAGTREIARFFVREISPDTYLNIMGQYHPAGRSSRHPVIHRRTTPEEFQEALCAAKEEGIRRLDRE